MKSRGQFLVVNTSRFILLILLTLSAHAAPSPIAWWRAEGNANDSAGSHDGSLVNGNTFAPGIVPGTSGQAFSLDGIDDEVSIPYSPDFDLTNGVTVAGWLRTSGSAEFSGLVDKFASHVSAK